MYIGGMKHSVTIDALRGLAALAVLAAHADAYDLVKFAPFTEHKVWLGHFGVALFFVLSGALIWRSAQRASLAEYALNRATRILPLYLASIAFAALLLPMVGSYIAIDASPEVIVRHLTFTQAFGEPVSRALNPVLWTLSFEATFYMLVPLLALSLRAGVGAAQAASLFLFAISFLPGLQFFGLFAVGIWMEECRRGRVRLAAGCAFIACFGVYCFAALQTEWLTASLAAIAVGSVYLISAPRIVGFVLPPLSAVGVISYSLYIWHYLILEMIGFRNDQLREVFGSLWGQDWFRASFTLAVIFAVSVASYLIIERPFMGPVRRWLSAIKLRPATI